MLLVPRILRWLPDFWNTSVPIAVEVLYQWRFRIHSRWIQATLWKGWCHWIHDSQLWNFEKLAVESLKILKFAFTEQTLNHTTTYEWWF